jgi:steroid 5-alpha reductase family enzyme
VNAWLVLSAGLAGMSLVFIGAWLWARRIDNYSLVDAVWAFGIGATGLSWLLAAGEGPSVKLLIAGLMVVLWSGRLGWHLQRRIRRAHPEEDARYGKLREVWRGREGIAFFLFFQMQAVSVILLALPFLTIGLDSDRSWSAWETVGLIVALGGILGEGIADAQMARFKAENHDSSAVCQTGLWGYSRHPNYFFEAVIWIGFYLYACGSDWGWATLHAPAILIFLLLKVTGIPPTEAAAVRRRGDAYRAYQTSVSPFIPWFRKPHPPTP